MKVFIGLTDIANITNNLAKGFKLLGHEVFTCVWNRSYFYPDVNYDLVIDNRPAGNSENIGLKYFFGIAGNLLQLLRKKNLCDLYIFYAPAVLPMKPIFKILRMLNKKIVCIFWGSDIRYWYALKQEMSQLGVDKEMLPFIEFARNRMGGSYFDKLRTVRNAERYADLILSQPQYSQFFRRPYNRATIPLDLTEYQNKVRSQEKLLVLHAPSVPEAKGTDRILEDVAALQAEGLEFEFRKIEKMPNRQLKKLLSEADILIDQLYSISISSVASEAMASGCAVLARYMPEYSKVEMPCPVVNTNIFTFKNDLKALILDHSRRRSLAEQGPNYVRKVNDCKRVATRILEALDAPNDQSYDFYPEFYKELVIPEWLLAEERRNARRKRVEFFKILFRTGTTRNT
jgi:hypothetical protein